MALKVIGVYFMLSFLILSVFGIKESKLKITEAQFKAFKGVDPCKSHELMEDACNKIAKPKESTGSFANGFPLCNTQYISLQLNCAGKITTVPTQILFCSWDNKIFYYLGKGQAPNHVMSYEADDTNIIFLPYKDFEYKANKTNTGA